MKRNSPAGPNKAERSLNDFLALERTAMANERTFLSYIRTALTLFVPGITGFHLAESLLLQIVALLFIPLGILVFVIGVIRFMKKRKANRAAADGKLP